MLCGRQRNSALKFGNGTPKGVVPVMFYAAAGSSGCTPRACATRAGLTMSHRGVAGEEAAVGLDHFADKVFEARSGTPAEFSPRLR